LSVRNCALEKIEVPFSAVPTLNKLPADERAKFEIGETGSFIHSLDSDIDLEFDSLRHIVDPEWQTKCEAERREGAFG
jgi:hypothetical protein